MYTLVSLFPVLVIFLPCVCIKEPQISLDTWHVSFRCCTVHADGRGSPWYRCNSFWSSLNTFYLRVHGHELVSFPCRAKGVAVMTHLTVTFVGSTELRAEFQLLLLICEQKLICMNTNLLPSVCHVARVGYMFIITELWGCRNHDKTSGTWVKGSAKTVTFWIKQVPPTGIVILPGKVDSILYVPLH